MLITALFIMAPSWKPLKCPSTDDWIDEQMNYGTSI